MFHVILVILFGIFKLLKSIHHDGISKLSILVALAASRTAVVVSVAAYELFKTAIIDH